MYEYCMKIVYVQVASVMVCIVVTVIVFMCDCVGVIQPTCVLVSLDVCVLPVCLFFYVLLDSVVVVFFITWVQVVAALFNVDLNVKYGSL